MQRDSCEPIVIARAGELLGVMTRRRFLGAIGAGASILLLPTLFGACEDSIGHLTGSGGGTGGALTFDLRTDVGIFRLVHTLEIVESAFYSALLASTAFTLFTADEREVLTDIRNVETLHREFLRTALGAQAVPDFSAQLDQATLTRFLASRDSILATARMLEHTGLATLNGAGKYIKDARNLLVAGKLASVEARHAAALRDFGPPAGTDATVAFAGDDVVDGNGRDVKLEAAATVTRLQSLAIIGEPLNTGLAISNAPSAAQGVPTPDFFPVVP